MKALALSAEVGLLAAVLGLPFALIAGHIMARKTFVGKSLVSTLLMLPLVLPPVVTGYLLLRLFASRGWLGGALQTFGVHVPFSTLGAVIAALVVGFPLYVASVRGAFEAIDKRYEDVAATLGSSRWQVFVRVTLPLALPGVAAGFVLTFARALGEFGATAVLAGNIEGKTRTLALAVYSLLDAPDGESAAAPLVILCVAISFAALAAHEALIRWQRRRFEVAHD
jgi:molybdate transport system permease protein